MRFIEDEVWHTIRAKYPLAYNHFHGSADEQRIVMGNDVPSSWMDDFFDGETDFDGEDWDDRHLYNYFDGLGIKVLIFYDGDEQKFGHSIHIDGKGMLSENITARLHERRTDAEKTAFYNAFVVHNSILSTSSSLS